MSTENTPVETPELAEDELTDQTATEVTEETTDTAEDTSDVKGKAAREAAKYRTQLRETESQLEAANSRIAALQSAEVHRIAGESLAAPEDMLTLTRTSVADYIRDDGTVDVAAVKTASQELVRSRPGLRKPSPVYDPTQGLGMPRDRGVSWSNMFDQ